MGLGLVRGLGLGLEGWVSGLVRETGRAAVRVRARARARRAVLRVAHLAGGLGLGLRLGLGLGRTSPVSISHTTSPRAHRSERSLTW